MSQPLTDAINALITYANEITGQSDTTLSDAVESLVDGYGGGGYTIDEIASTEPSGAITLTTPTVRKGAFYNNTLLTSVTTRGTTTINGDAFNGCTNITYADLTGVTSFGGPTIFRGCSKLATVLLPDLETITNQAFNGAPIAGTLKLQSLTSGSGNNAFTSKYITKIYIFKNFSISYQQNLFNGCTGVTDIYVPWSSGEVSGAPWGASNATVHYDTVYDENEEPIT